MQFSRADLADFAYFLAIAKHRSFRRAGQEVGVTASALSHALKGLETRLNVRLLNRTNRSVTLTVAGEELLAVIQGPFEAIDRASDVLERHRGLPSGHIRLNVAEDAAMLLLGPVMPIFVDRYPEVQIDIAVNNRLVDIIEEGFDAGIRYGGTVPEDMIAQRLSADIRWVVAGAPEYFARFGKPQHPRDLEAHRCIQIKLGDNRIYKWEFDRDGAEIEFAVPGAVTINSTQTARTLALNGTGLMYAPEPCVSRQVEDGTLTIAMEDWASMGPGFHLYYSSRRQLPAGLRLLVDLVREIRPLGL
ncbi:LysR family transcriptional regulator [Novosphingobium sp. P6W]|uniref:LysR family transcriptional regulator n=1 Tax=Novosphingobium sp. P6W TaxID=1609758 RepID=UPI0005C2D07D|nr:LysR family transcriptional regulator [Novosphingobium sp. P6W]AXB76009.1 LysR family transcriptional regulator [Novosphingobium sp. P6W]KIS31205.1 LysR family transcriptional regulator [Novosphingobium sp. P6W]